MAVVKELLRAESDGTLSFGDYTLASKTKLEDFEFQGNLYKVKTFAEITKLEKNGRHGSPRIRNFRTRPVAAATAACGQGGLSPAL